MLFRYACSMYGFGLIGKKIERRRGMCENVGPSGDSTIEQAEEVGRYISVIGALVLRV